MNKNWMRHVLDDLQREHLLFRYCKLVELLTNKYNCSYDCDNCIGRTQNRRLYEVIRWM